MNIYFTGFMATGKSRIGEATARKMNMTFVDTDKFIEAKQGCSVADIFKNQGELAFRKLELETVRELSSSPGHVIALGGGGLTQPEIVEIIRKTGVLVSLWAPIEVLSERIGRKTTRPLMLGLNDEERKVKISEMLEERKPLYDLADFSIKSCEETSIDHLAKQIRSFIEAWSHKKVVVKTKNAEYPIFIGNKIIPHFSTVLKALNLNTDYLMVTDQNVYNAQRQNVTGIQRQVGACRLFRFPSGEKFKSLHTLNRLYTYMLRKGYSRKTTLIQFSGGVVGDMAGYGAASYQRGIDFIQVPTSLLAMVDSSVGGKVAVNHPLGKNMIGAFHQPKAVFIDIATLNTLPEQEFLAGMAEVIKYGVIWDREFFDFLLENSEGILAKDPELLSKMITRCCQIKAEVVSQDEKEHGIRGILNYGHTFGHAIEKLTDYEKYSHGIAVALGMRVAGKLATLSGLWSPADEQLQTRILNAYGFPRFEAVDKDDAWNAMGVDKKADKGKRVFILPVRIGSVKITSDVTKDKVDLAWDQIR